jgi:hypothetical protein
VRGSEGVAKNLDGFGSCGGEPREEAQEQAPQENAHRTGARQRASSSMAIFSARRNF